MLKKFRRLLRCVGILIMWVLLPHVTKMVRETRGTSAAVTYEGWFFQKVLGKNRAAYWPTSRFSTIIHADKIKIGIGSELGASPGCYIQGVNGIQVGNYVTVAPNVGVISASHNIYDYFQHEKNIPIKIGNYCWLGFGCTILPGVEIGDHTVVAAGAVVSKSFPDGYCVLGGVPAKIIKVIDKEKVIERKNKFEYIGYIKSNKI